MCAIFNHKKYLDKLCALTSTKISETPLSRAGTSRLLQHTIRICEKEKVNKRESNEGNKDRRKRDGRKEGRKKGRKEGRKQGRKEGKKEGRKEAKEKEVRNE